jgi:Rrf2 family protein
VANFVRISEPASLALHAAALLAQRKDERLSNQQIAAALRVSEHHLAKVMQQLAKAGVLDSTRGPHGGFQLNRPAEGISLLEVFEAAEGPLGDAECLLAERVCDGSECMVGELVHSVHKHVRQYLAENTLAQLAHRFTLDAS